MSESAALLPDDDYDDDDDDGGELDCECCRWVTDDEVRETVRDYLEEIGLTLPELQAQARRGWFDHHNADWAWFYIDSILRYTDVEIP